jgi:C-terminal processing protease CtpA/Prc
MRRPLAIATLAAVAIAGCHRSGDSCDPASQKEAVLATAREWYLYQELLPPAVDLAAYATPSDLLDALTAAARAQGKDRGWSYLTTLQATQQFFAEGQSVGFGIVTLARGTDPQQRLFLAQVIRGSAAAAAGFVRGDEILAIGDGPTALVPAADLLAQGSLGSAYGPAEVGVTRVFEVRTSAGAIEQRTVAKRLYSLDPLPSYAIFPRPAPLAPAGYLSLRTFVSTAEAPLRQAFAAFQAAGVSDVAVDVRYNGGGLVSLAELLADLLAAGRVAEPMYAQHLNASHAGQGATGHFAAVPEAIAPTRIAFITTGATASASELVPNVLDPYASVALVGDRTYGKPVGQFLFGNPACGTTLALIAFRLVNASGNGDYFDGLPDPPGFRGPLCQAPDDLGQPQESPLEASTAAALYWLENGTCPPAPAGARLRQATRFPSPPRPTPAQVAMPGLF